MDKFFKVLLTLGVVITPLLANDGDVLAAVFGGMFIIFLIMFVITIFFLLAQSSFAKTITTSNPMLNTSPVWIWTQLIPIWSLVAVPVTLLKLDAQFKAYIQEHNLTEADIKMYTNLWGWIWYGGTIVSFFIPLGGIVALVGLIGFWIHLNSVKKSIIIHKLNNTQQSSQTQEQ